MSGAPFRGPRAQSPPTQPDAPTTFRPRRNAAIGSCVPWRQSGARAGRLRDQQRRDDAEVVHDGGARLDHFPPPSLRREAIRLDLAVARENGAHERHDEEDEEEKHVGERVAKHGLNDISQQIFVILQADTAAHNGFRQGGLRWGRL